MKKRVFNILLCVVMVVGLMPTSFAASTQTTSTDTATKKTVMLGSNSPLGYDSTTKKYDKLYFGTYYTSEDDATATPYEWRILDGETSTGDKGLFILSMNTYDGIYFSHPPTDKQAAADIYQNQWTDKYCYARAWCGGFATSKMFATAEQQAMFATTKTNESYKPKDNALWLACGNDAGSISNGALSGDKAFYLSAEEYENTNYGLAEDKKTGYMLRSSSSASFVTEGQTIYNGVGILATPGFLPSRIYWKEYSGNTFTFTETAFDKWFTIFDFFGSVSEETYNYVYATHTARPAMNLDANKVLYITAADNSGHSIAYGSDISTADTYEWKTVLLNGDTSFETGVELTDAPENLVFGANGGKMNVNYTLGGDYDAVTASLTDKDGNIIYYGTIDKTVTIPANLTDGVYTLRITAEDRNDEKVSDLASQPYVAQIKVANAHNHAICGANSCTDEGHTAIDWTPITTTEELAEMKSDSHCFLIGDVEAPTDRAVKGTLCTNGFKVTGTLTAGDGLTVTDCKSTSTTIPNISVSENATYTQYGVSVTSLSAGKGSTLNLYGGATTESANTKISELSENVKLNIYRKAIVNGVGDEKAKLVNGCEATIHEDGYLGPATVEGTGKIIVENKGKLYSVDLEDSSVLTVEDGGTVVDFVKSEASGSTINLHRCTVKSINSNGNVNLYGAVNYSDGSGDNGTTFKVTEAINICADLGNKATYPAIIDIKNDGGTLKLTDGVFTSGWSTQMKENAGNFGQYFVSASGYEVDKNESGELYCKKIGHVAGNHPICGAECEDGQNHSNVQWTELATWEALKSYSKDQRGDYYLNPGNYCLTADIPLDGRLVIDETVNIDLNGNKLNLNGYYGILVKSGTLNICDCVGTGQITGGIYTSTKTNGGAINMSGGEVNLYGGAITGNQAYYGGAVYVPSGATFNMYGGTLSENTAGAIDGSTSDTYYAKGGAVYVDGGAFNMNGGTIKENKSETKNTSSTGVNDGGGAVYINGGEFNMSGGTITQNSATRFEGNYVKSSAAGWDFGGCGVRVFDGTFTMTGGNFESQPDAVQVDSGGTFNLKGGTLTGGKCTNGCRSTVTGTPNGSRGGESATNYRGDCTIWQNGGTVNMTGGNIENSDEPVTIFGGAFNMSGGSIAKCSYPVQIKGGAFNLSGGRIGSDEYKSTTGVALTAGTFNMSGGEISNLKKGVEVASGTTFKVSGAPMITGNYDTTIYGGKISQNVCLASGAQMTVGTLTNGASIGVTMATGNGVFASGGSSYVSNFFSDDSIYKVETSGDNLQLTGTTITGARVLVNGTELDKKADGTYFLDVELGQSVQLSANIEPGNAQQSVMWSTSSSAAEYIEIDQDGKLTGIKSSQGSYYNAYLVYNNGKNTKTISVRVVEPEYYTVTYDMQDHGTPMDSLQVTPGNTIKKPDDPNATGYVFDGWYKDSEFTQKWDFDKDIVTTNTTLYAKWSAESCYVTLDPAGGACSPTYIWVTFGQKYGTLPEPTRTGYTFEGWFDCNNSKITEETVLNTVPAETKAGRTLTAHWTALPATAPTVIAGGNVNLTYGYQKSGNISVTATAADGATTISGYQWYTCDGNGENAVKIDNATSESYTIETGKAAGTYYYYCEVTAKRDDNNTTTTAKSDVISVTVGKAQLNAAVTMANYAYGADVSVPSVSGNTGNGAVTYYYNTSDSNSGGTKWENMTSTTLNVGNYYIYAKIAETDNYATFTTSAAAFEVTKTDPTVSAWPTISGTVYVNDGELTNDRLSGGTSVVGGTFSITGVKSWNESGSQTTEVTFTPSDQNYNTIKHNINVTVSKRTVQSITSTIPAITDKNYNTAMGDLGLPTMVSIKTTDGKIFDNVSIGWNNYTPTKLEAQTLTGTLKLDSINNEVQQAETPVTTTVSVTLKALAPGSVSFTDKTATYTGEPITDTIADTELPESVQSVAYTYSGEGYAASATAPTDAGTYTVTASFTMKAGYTQLEDATAALTITKADGSVTAPTAAENLVYNGESQALIKAGTSDTGEVQYRLGTDGAYGTAVPTATAAGTYKVYYKVVGDKNHKDVAEQSVDVSIGRKPIDVPAADAKEFTYDGTEKTYTIADSADYTVSGNKQTAANEAGYTVTVALKDKENTVWADTKTDEDKTYDFIIKKKPVIAPAADETVFTYDGTEKTYNVVGTDDYTVSGNTQTAANEAGYTVTVALTDKANTIWADTKTDEDKTYDFIIKKKPVIAPAADETVFTYDGTEKTYNIVGTDDYTVSGNTQTAANEAGYTVTVALKDAANHKWNDGTTADKTFAFKIKKAPVTITVKDKGIRTGGTLPDFTEPKLDEDFTVSGLIGEDKLTTYPTIYFEPETPDLSVVGEVPIKAKDADAGNNYIINYVDGKLTISRRPSKDKTETTVNSDGSTTKTETKSDGTVVETTTGKDGSTSTVESKTETKSDGTKVETKTETETKSDGTTVESKTEVATDKDGAKTETKTEVTTAKDGTKTEVKTEAVTAKDGTKSETTSEVKTDAEGVKSEATTTKITTADGTTGTTKTTVENGETKTEAEAEVSAKAVEAAQKENKVVTVPIEVKATSDTTTATTVNINIEIKSGGQSGSGDAVKIEIPVTNAGSGTVAVLVKADGTEEIIKTTLPTESGVEISVEGKATIKIVDNSKSYADTEDHWSKDEVNFVSSRELFNGVGDGNFGVSESMTRGMVNTVLARLAGENTNGGENWYDKGTEWAKQNGVSDGTNPTESVTREQLATMLYRYAGAPEVSGVIKFDDADEVSVYAQNALLWAVRNGIVNGMDETHIAPSAQAERAQVAAMMARFLKNL